MKSDYVLPADTGGKIRTYNLLRELSKLCDVTYLSFKPPEIPPGGAEAGRFASRERSIARAEEKKHGVGFYGRVLRGLASPLPYVAQKYRSADMVAAQRRFFQEARSQAPGLAPVILCDFLEMAPNVLWELPCPKVLFQHNVETVIWQRYCDTERHPFKKAYFQIESRRMARYEREACRRFDLVLTVSEGDRQMLRNDFGVTRDIEVIDTAVDTDYFRPPPESQTTRNRLLFLGSLDWLPNVDGVAWFVTHIYPRIKAACPDVSLDIVGRRPGGAIHAATCHDPSIRVLPDVPDVRPHLAAADLFVVPLRVGGGSRIKIYEAMAMRSAVVSTTVGAEGLPVVAGRHLAIGDSPQQFAEQVVTLLGDPVRKARLASAGHQLVKENCQWKHSARKLYERCSALTR
jgi:glycosyltransferase involved in cell wall biosynthesis